ncbi:unnamed protein product, partial [Meganyctiphanes norvegica]
MDKSVCSICVNTFDASNHRPRALPCGHGFCTACIQACISKGNRNCPRCRVEHGANLATDLPVSFILEEFIHKLQISDVEMCPKHKGVPLHFFCKSHGFKICHSCAVIEHPPTSCQLISLEDAINEKQSQIATVQKQNQSILNTQKDLEMLLKDNIDDVSEQQKKKENVQKEVKELLTKIEKFDKDISRKEKVQEQIKNAIQGCQKKNTHFVNMVKALNDAKHNQDIGHNFETVSGEILECKKWEETLRKELNLWKMYQDNYAAVTRGGVLRCSKVQKEGGKITISKLSKEVKPPSNVTLIQEAQLGLTSATATVFLDISARGKRLGMVQVRPGERLGRVQVRVMGDRPEGQQFIMLALGTDGPSFKGANFGLMDTHILLYEYATETGAKAKNAILNIPEWTQKDTASRGRLFGDDKDAGSFLIMSKNSNERFSGYFGDVISGMDVIDKAASPVYHITYITITDCGIVLDY